MKTKTNTTKATTNATTTPTSQPINQKPLLIQPVVMRTASLWIKGTTPLIQHAWSKKALEMIRMTAAERRKVPKTGRDPISEGKNAAYVDEDGNFGIPAMAVKCAMIEVAHKDIGLPKTLVRKALRFQSCGVIPMECDHPIIREDIVRVGNGATDLRYRPEFRKWSANIKFNYDADLLSIQDVLNLVDRAGFSVGIGEWRPEKNGEYGTFEVDRSLPIQDYSVTDKNSDSQ